MKKVSIIIPVYKSGKAVDTVKKLQEDPYLNKEFILYVSSPEESFLKELDKLKDYTNVKIIIKNERVGKVTAVNRAVKLAKGDVFIFFDADAIPAKFNIGDVVKACKEYELVEFPKTKIPKNLIGKLTHIEYFGYFGILQRVSSRIKRSIALNGAGFAVRRDVWEKLGGYRRVILEDMDFATRIYIMGGKYYLLDNTIIKIEPVPTWKKWIDQRKRWAYGGVEWFFTYPKTILSFFIKYPLWLLAYIMFINPAIPLYFLSFLLPHNWLY
ncbi:MAG TPA: glycosyltransferase family 2 protein, partial [Candidatus Nanopusillus sp.]|nr:glycosyltransferase family 2 protein [Candidatus Nanopusillus sp.]